VGPHLPAPERVALLRARSLFLRKFFSRLNADVADPVFLVRVGREEIFGPVVSVMRAPDLDAAIMLTNRSRYGNTASLFTQSGAAARTFRERIQAGMLGINVTVRTFIRRFTRLSLGFSKKLENLQAAIAVFICYYNFCWRPGKMRITPAMAARVTHRFWIFADLMAELERI
jgi:hypothetical protein